MTVRCLRCDFTATVKQWRGTDHRKTCTKEGWLNKKIEAAEIKNAAKMESTARALQDIWLKQEVLKAGKLIHTKNTDA
jgi:hypothetical protein